MPPYLHTPVTASVRFVGFHGRVGLGLEMPESTSCPLIAAGSASRAGGPPGPWRPAAAASGSAGAGRGGPHQVGTAAYVARPGPARSRAGRRGKGGVSGGGERVVAEFGQDVAGLPEDLAGLGQRGAL